MSFQAYLDTIEARTGKSPAAERGWTADNGFAPGIKPMAIVAALKEELGLAHGHATADHLAVYENAAEAA